MLNKKQLKYLIEDEKKAIKYYSKHGLRTIAKDEARHKRILERKLAKL